MEPKRQHTSKRQLEMSLLLERRLMTTSNDALLGETSSEDGAVDEEGRGGGTS